MREQNRKEIVEKLGEEIKAMVKEHSVPFIVSRSYLKNDRGKMGQPTTGGGSWT